MTVGLLIGSAGIVLGMILGAIFLYFRQSVVNFVQFVTGQNLWDPSIRFLTELPSRTDPMEVLAICGLGLAVQLSRDALSGAEGREYRPCAGVAL